MLPLRIRITGSSLLCPPNCKNSPLPHLRPIHQTAAGSLPDSCLISHKLVLPLAHFFLFCFLLLLIPFSPCPLRPPPVSLWSSHFIFLPTNATQQSLKKCHFCLLLLFCNFSVSLLFSWEFIYRMPFFCPQLSHLSVSLSLSVSPSLSLTLTHSISLSSGCLCTLTEHTVDSVEVLHAILKSIMIGKNLYFFFFTYDTKMT